MAEQDRLRALQMGVARHDRRPDLLCHTDEPGLQVDHAGHAFDQG